MIKRLILCAVAAAALGTGLTGAHHYAASGSGVTRLLTDRSPGERPKGALLQTKPGYVTHLYQPPEDRAPVPGLSWDAAIVPPLEFAISGYIPVNPVVLPDANVSALSGQDYWDVPGWQIDLRPPSYSGGVGVPVSPVPEPSTWAMMALGVLWVGGMLRRERVGVLV